MVPKESNVASVRSGNRFRETGRLSGKPATLPETPFLVGGFPPDWVAGLLRNQWPVSSGITGRFRPEYATMIADIANERKIWQDIGSWMDRRQRLIDSEVKHMIQSQTMVSAEEIAVLTGGILKVLRDNIKDRKTLEAIGHGIGMLLPEPDRQNVLEAKIV